MKRLLIVLILSTTTVSCGVRYSASLPTLNSSAPLYREHPQLSEVQIDSLYTIFSKSVTFYDEFLEQSLIALSYYPDLVGVKIEFKPSNEKTTMAARPKPRTLFSKRRRRYLILINSGESDFDGVKLHDTPFNAQIGVIGHELAHIADYERRNMFSVLGVLFRYADRGRKSLFENEIDWATIERGLGWQLYDWATFSLNNSYSTDEFKEFKRKHYLSPEQIKELINFYSKYSDSL
ncbi:MAG: hypothetical protein SNJ33_01910 [Rikenellaceae bacterium]